MPKKPFIKKLYQLTIISLLIIISISQTQAANFDLVSDTKFCYKAKTGAYINAGVSQGGDWIYYTVPTNFQEKISELLCLRGPEYSPPVKDGLSNNTLTGSNIFFRIKDSGIDWKFSTNFESTGWGIDVVYKGLEECMDDISMKSRVFSIKLNKFYQNFENLSENEESCRQEEIRNPTETQECNTAFLKDASDIVLKNTNSCNFGKDVYGTGANLQKSCYYQPDKAAIKLPWVPGRVFICTGSGTDSRESSNFSSVNAGWISCTNTNTKIQDITTQQVYNVPILASLIDSIKYTVVYNRTSGCDACPIKDGRSHIQNCPGYIPPASTNCRPSSGEECTFGAGGSELERASDAKNCAKTDLDRNQRFQTRLVANNKTYFCSSTNLTVECDITKQNATYESDEIFLKNSSISTVRTFININPASGCKYIKKDPEKENCKLKSTDPTAASCTFGPLKNDPDPASATNFENCDELKDTEGYLEKDGKHIYCSPKNIKVFCDKQIPTGYPGLFNNTVSDTGGQSKDYTNFKEIFSTYKASPYNCKEGLPPVLPNQCNVTTDRSTFNCKFSSACFAKNQPVPFERIFNQDVRKGALYCFNDDTTNSEKGTKYWCPTESRQIVKYERPSETITNSNNVFVLKKTWGNENCIKFSEIANECDKDGEYFDTANGKKRCQCSRQFNPNYDPFVCGVTPDISWCEPRCKLLDVNEQALVPVEINSPLALIKVVATFLFWAAVLLFVVNFISAGIEYIKGADEPDKIKEATTRITNTIFGFIFLIVVSGVLNFILTLFKDIVVPK